MKHPSDSRKQPAALARVAALLITLGVSGLGALSYFSSHAPARWTRFGDSGPLSGETARDFGLAIFVIGLLPLAFFARSAKHAGWFATIVVVAFWVLVFVPLMVR